jgi:hypothetical protein
MVLGDGQQLLLIIAVLYLSDCCWWVPRLAWVLGSPWGGGLGLRFPGSTLGNARGALVLQPILPSLGRSYELHPCPWSWGREGLLSWTSTAVSTGGRPPQTGRQVAWKDIKDIDAVGEDVHVNGELFLPARSALLAQTWTEDLRALWQSPAGNREAAWRERWLHVLQPEDLREKERQALVLARSCQAASVLQFAAMFALAPLLCRRFGLGLGILFAGGVVLLLALVNAGLYARAHRRLYPEAAADRIKHALIMCISFPLSARAGDAVLRRLFAGLPAPAVVMSLGDPAGARTALLRWWRDLFYPLTLTELEESAQKIVAEHLARERAFWTEWIQQHKLEIWLEETAADWLDGDLSECPRCRAHYLQAEGDCLECPGVQLRPKQGDGHVG